MLTTEELEIDAEAKELYERLEKKNADWQRNCDEWLLKAREHMEVSEETEAVMRKCDYGEAAAFILSQAETIAELMKAIDDLSEPAIKSFKMENGAFDIALTGPVVERIAVAMVGHFKATGAENYVEMSLYDREAPYQRYCVTVQKVGAKSPHDLLREAESALAHATKEDD